ncbi:uncharacterized protein PHALS_03453 [Plasmopara halstedii]|uniref:Uncharacterized protein n=1 Tax=Plasmopara halstedii TaxID=4781 RepID=A0A0P1AZ13_PLAHL|nr:uncharacterized protein PHALS_03453 [Plasmopara halstedii]CEG46772.1 hypothetical protein PHALS_03453 [Plasmopara halstedii]|eukprot:XP_024583141.1 hypothetical protein PHALS_03453 [Plasmopara halstedii]
MIAEVRVTTCTERRDGYIKQALLLSAVAFEPGEGISLSFEDQGILPEKIIRVDPSLRRTFGTESLVVAAKKCRLVHVGMVLYCSRLDSD